MSTMEKIVSFRATPEEKEALEETARAAGCGLSEYIRRRSFENPDDGLREAILSLVEYSRSIWAHIQLMCDASGMTAEERQPVVDFYKKMAVDIENGEGE